MSSSEYDVVIIGGGPAGSTTGAMMRKYGQHRVLILEREQFPREHVGESQLPPIGPILGEMGVWDEVEKAQFPIKVGLTLRWGRDPELWDFDFLPEGKLAPAPRPSPFSGQRTRTALQVDRAKYDDILLRHAETLGCEVRQQAKVTKVHRDSDRIAGLELAGGERIEAKWYVDASGHGAIVRRQMGVKVETPGQLKNVAAWDYWDNVEWADTIGVGGTRVQVLSIGYGWVWFIPVAPTRASVGLVVSADYYKKEGRPLDELYLEAIRAEPRVAELLEQASMRGEIKSTKDWSFLSERACGDNWFLVGEAVGFADPILAAGMTLAQSGARELAFTLLSLLEGEHDADWLKRYYDDNQRTRIWQHIRFADFWYATNGQLSDLQTECQAIATDAGLTLSADEAWSWLAQGGFAHDVIGGAQVAGHDLASAKQITQRLSGERAGWHVAKYNMVRLQLDGAKRVQVPYYRQGKVLEIVAFERDGKRLSMVGPVGLVAKLMPTFPHVPKLMQACRAEFEKQLGPGPAQAAVYNALQALELLLSEGWAQGTVQPGAAYLQIETPEEGAVIHGHRPISDGART